MKQLINHISIVLTAIFCLVMLEGCRHQVEHATRVHQVPAIYPDYVGVEFYSKAQKIEIRLSQYYTVPAYVLIPDGKGPFPAINLLHDHGAHLYIGKEKMIRPLSCEDKAVVKDAEEWLAGYEGQFFGDYLARQGYVVFSADAPMWGERGQKEGPRRDRYDMIAGNMMLYGIDLSAWMTYDDIAGTEFLAQMPEVDASRIGCTGWSMGAYRAWMLAALSDRIKVSASVCWMVTADEQLSFKE